MKYKAIAIDGPSGAGKSTMAKALARELGFLYADTGALYRAVALAAKRHGAAPSDRAALSALLPEISVDLDYRNGAQVTLLDGRDVSEELRAEDVSQAASAVSAHPEVRAFLLETQRRLARENNVVMDGRDIATVVLPDADVKIFLTASPEDRARRRYEENRARGQDVTFEETLANVKRRDENDSTRAAAPLKKHEDAVLLDTTGNTLEQSAALLLQTVRDRL